MAADVVAAAALIAAIAVVAARLDTEPAQGVRTLVAETRPSPDDGLVKQGLPPADDCHKRGITPRSGVGTCVLPDGNELTAVEPGGTVRLEGLELRSHGIEVLDRIGPASAPLEPTGVWVRVKLAITNTLDGSAGFSNSQVALTLGSKTALGPNSYAAASDPQALETRAADLRAGETAEGAVTFDVTRKLANRYLRTYAGLRVVTFGENTGSHSRTGLIRLAG